MPIKKINGIDLYYEQHGKGEPLILIAGYSADHNVWLHVIDTLAKHFQVTIFDNRGAGKTEAPAGDYTLAQMAQDTAELMTALDIEKAHIFGHSMGGKIAQTFAANYPDRVNKLILVGTQTPPIQFPIIYLNVLHDELLKRGIPLELIIRNAFAWLYHDGFFKDEAKVNQELERTKKQTELSTANGIQGQTAALAIDITDQLKKINAKTLVITGNKDVLVLPNESEYLANNIKHAQLSIIENCGHMIQIEQPEIFLALVIDFLTH